MNFFVRIVLLPLLLVIASGVLIIPFMPIYLFMMPSLESLFVVLLLIGLWPMCVAMSHSAFFVEHFIGRYLPKGASEQYDMFGGWHLTMYVRLAVGAGDFLSSALHDYGRSLDTKTILRGNKLIDRHRAIARYVWPGMTISAIGAIGLVLIQVLEIPAGPISQTP